MNLEGEVVLLYPPPPTSLLPPSPSKNAFHMRTLFHPLASIACALKIAYVFINKENYFFIPNIILHDFVNKWLIHDQIGDQILCKESIFPPIICFLYILLRRFIIGAHNWCIHKNKNKIYIVWLYVLSTFVNENIIYGVFSIKDCPSHTSLLLSIKSSPCKKMSGDSCVESWKIGG